MAVFFSLSLMANVYISRTGSYIAAVIFSYFANRFWSFHQCESPAGLRQFARFFLMNTAALGLSIFCIYLFVTTLNASDTLAYLVTIPLTTLINYLGHKTWTFSRES